MKNYFVPQLNHKGCALACIEMIIHINGINLSNRKVKIIRSIPNITTIYDIVKILEILNIKCSTYYKSDRNIQSIKKKLPIIIHFSNHFGILYEINDKKCTLADPSKYKVKSVSISKIEKRWSGYFIEFDLIKNNWQKIFQRNKFLIPYFLKINILYIIAIFIIIMCFSKL
ncbi:MAG: cysteine peptidase family C39 domain-containing protein [Bacilli bacterium]